MNGIILKDLENILISCVIIKEFVITEGFEDFIEIFREEYEFDLKDIPNNLWNRSVDKIYGYSENEKDYTVIVLY